MAKLLIIDDDRDILNRIGLDLKELGYELSYATSGREGLRKFLENEVDLVLLDQFMGDFNGLELFKKIQKEKTELPPVIMMTAYASIDLVIEFFQQGGQDFIEKPIHIDILNAKIAKHIESHQKLQKEIKRRKEGEDRLRDRENYFRALIENASEVISVVDASGNILYNSNSVKTVLGHTPEELIGQNFFYFIHPEDRKKTREIFSENLKNENTNFSLVYRSRHAQGNWQLIRSVCQVNLDDPIVEGVVLNSLDITEKKRLEEQLFLRQRMDFLGNLAGGIAHDFNNLLTGAIGNLSLLDLNSEKFSQEENYYLRQVMQSCQQASELIKQFQNLSTGKNSEKESVDISDVIIEVMGILSRTTDRLIHKKIEVEPDKFYTMANYGELHQVFLNLGTNAIQAIEENGVSPESYIQVTAEKNREVVKIGEKTLEVGHYIHVRFEDSGGGIPERITQKIFDPFFTTKEKVGKQGQGLGLAMVYNIITQHNNGYLSLESEWGKGTVFNIYLPLVLATPAKKEKSFSSFSMPKGDETILIIDDEQMVREISSAMLNQMGYNTIVAGDGKTALSMYEENQDKIKLIILDLTMPEMSGQMVMERILQINKEVKVIISSGHSTDYGQNTILNRANGYVSKPYTMEKLCSNVRTVLDAL